MLFAKSTMLLLCLIMALFLWERVKYVKYVPLWYYCVFEYDTMVLPWFVDIHHDIFYFYIIWKKAIVLLFFFLLYYHVIWGYLPWYYDVFGKGMIISCFVDCVTW